MMNSNGGFQVEENNGILSLVYHHPIFRSIPQTQNPTSDEAVIDDTPILQPLFVCPEIRFNSSSQQSDDQSLIRISTSPEYISYTSDEHGDHSLLPLFWCNNKEFDDGGGCDVCQKSNYGTDYFYCDKCDYTFHKECVQSPSMIKHPYHPEHYLHLFGRFYDRTEKCLCCEGEITLGLVYCCSRCDVLMHTTCAMKSIPFVVDQQKSHDHSLTLFAKASLICNVCGLIRSRSLTYVCLKCSFAAHSDCMNAPRIIKISRHHHRISYTSLLPVREWSCGVCRKSIDGEYGAYTCDKCHNYAVHTRCALREDVWDGVDLEGILEEDDISKDAKPFEMISEGVILHFLHDHHLQLEVNILYDENKLCETCGMPIAEGNFYSCMGCKFMLHEACAMSPRRIQHALHPHPLSLKLKRDGSNIFRCDACGRLCNGFVYHCPKEECNFDLDVRCASISEPFDFQGHEHSLFLALPPDVTPTCTVCKTICRRQFNCIECDFIICFRCATLPFKAKYKHDKHLLTLLWGEEVWEGDWCELCEHNLRDKATKLFYWCNICCTTLHISCLFGKDIYMKPGQITDQDPDQVIQVLAKSNLSRPFCVVCKYTCQGRIYLAKNHIMCSLNCAFNIFF